MIARAALYAFSLLSVVHLAMAEWATKGPEVWIEVGDAVLTRVTLNLTLSVGYGLLALLATVMLCLDAD